MPAIVKVSGLQELADNVRNVSGPVMQEALKRAHDVAGAVIKNALQATAPRGKTGRLARSIIVYQAKPSKFDVFNRPQPRTLIGPSKDAFYAYFIEYGWIWSKGRRLRQATKTAHSQQGPTTGGRHIPGRPWARPAYDSVESVAFDAAKEAFLDVIDSATR